MASTRKRSVVARLLDLETKYTAPGRVPGTMLTRVLMPDGIGMGWTLSLGHMLEPKSQFTGRLLEDVLALAEKTRSGPNSKSRAPKAAT
jgi:hypothetical protein